MIFALNKLERAIAICVCTRMDVINAVFIIEVKRVVFSNTIEVTPSGDFANQFIFILAYQSAVI